MLENQPCVRHKEMSTAIFVKLLKKRPKTLLVKKTPFLLVKVMLEF